jgi:hypothetical protein
MKPTEYMIQHPQCETLYWSFSMGWTEKEWASTFTEKERDAIRLPIAGIWIVL